MPVNPQARKVLYKVRYLKSVKTYLGITIESSLYIVLLLEVRNKSAVFKLYVLISLL